MIIGVGIDLVDLERFEKAVSGTPKLIDRLFAESERGVSNQTLAGRFAAKEAFVKAVGDPKGLHWHEVEIIKDALGKPHIETSGGTAELVAQAGIKKLHLSISHDGGKAIAMVVAEGGA
jgi:holo-[acyl-carrier protein] synthase